ncbi:hypothetical protein GCM10011378_40730 [Hymenobacter glacieicola]|uniref:Methyltransferase n=2 Tax=Hymenobacter glacieicola TaxID=1562124 RepID=A0ABQ1X585_9BACT|nr:hypothetical protein GCM10011378_40730 [Hymenobacter glacieicola]
MAHGLEHKLFFLEHLPELEALLDWGCADGTLLAEVRKQRPEILLLGHDTDERMVDQAVAKFDGLEWNKKATIWEDAPSALEALRFTAEWAYRGRKVPFSEPARQYGGTGILFSSVLHEMYTHGTSAQMRQHWKDVAATGVDYIVIRDMFWGPQGDYLLSEYPTPYCQFIKWIAKGTHSAQLTEFNASLPCGESTMEARIATEYLLKYPFVENWERELEEIYFALPDLRPVLAPLGYEPVYWNHHCPDFIQERIKKDTSIDIPFNTHLSAIFRRK